MRILIALVAASGLFAQLRPPRPIDAYLELTGDQRSRVDADQAEYARQERTAAVRQAQLSIEIQRETSAEPLNPAALDVRYAEQETLRRQSDARTKKLIADNYAVLTAPQRQKLVALQESQRLLVLAASARYSGLLEDACIAWPTPPANELVAYLQLTAEQARAIASRQGEFAVAAAGLQWEAFLAGVAFDRANNAEPLDPQVLGDLAVRRESAQREIAGRRKKLIAENQAALTTRQKQLLDALTEAEKLAPLLREANRVFVEEPRILPYYLEGSLRSTLCRSGSFSFLP
ncbi:MAG: hypothetical protein FJW32_26590 [Acidobacteria bacterium]|nr:hypothetical protein [Acidobacteriota bacterium]